MQTDFSKDLLADPMMARSEAILRKCVHCGFCSATCPTYLLTGDELDGPRGRIYLMKDMLETNRPADERTVRHIDRCLSCLSCMTTCPSGVDYGQLVDHARAHIEATYRRPLADRALRAALARILPNRRVVGVALRLGRLAQPFAGLLPKRLEAMLALLPSRDRAGAPCYGVHRAEGPRRARAILLAGCVQNALDARIRAATIAFLTRCGVETIVVRGADCCGSLEHHLGKRERAKGAARRAMEAWRPEIEKGADFIVSDASGCSATLRLYADLFQDDDSATAGLASRISAMACDISAVAARLDIEPRIDVGALRVAHQSPCSLQHGQRAGELPAELLQRVGFHVVPIAESHICCGSAGTYNILQPDFARRLRARKVEALRASGCDVVATSNIGCMMQIRSDAAAPPIVHVVELLNWATGGARPTALERHSK